jgi:hypothetical protein
MNMKFLFPPFFETILSVGSGSGSETPIVIFTLQDYARGLESMKEAEMWMKYSTLSETKTLSFKKEIAKNIEFLSEKVRSEKTTVFFLFF